MSGADSSSRRGVIGEALALAALPATGSAQAPGIRRLLSFRYGRARRFTPHGTRLRMRITNRRNIVAIHTSGDNGAT